jgi:WD40 repeat protein
LETFIPIISSNQLRKQTKETNRMISRMTNQAKDDTRSNVEICTTVTFTPNSSVIATGYDSGFIRLWNVESKKELLVLKGHKEKITSLLFSPDGKLLISGSLDRRIIIWDAYPGHIIKILRGYWGAVTSLAINNTGTMLASATADNRIRLWNIKKSWKKTHELRDHVNTITKIAFSPTSNLLASASWDHKIMIWKVANGKKVGELKGHFGPISDLAYSSDGRVIVTGSSDGTIKVWDAEKVKEISVIASVDSSISSVAYHPIRRVIVAGSHDKIVRIWDAKTNKIINTIADHKEAILDVSFSSNGLLLLTLSVDGDIKIWNVNELLGIKDTRLLTQVKEALKFDNVKRVVSDVWDVTIGKLVDKKEDKSQDKEIETTRVKMLQELPELFALMKDKEEMSLADLQTKYNCDQTLAEEVLVTLLKEGKINGSFNSFTGVFSVYNKQPEDIHEEELSSASTDLTKTCFYCGEPIDESLLTCPACDEEIARCPVCKMTLNFDSELGVCIFCGVKGHLSHMKEAVKVTGSCPVCRKELSWDSEITSFKREPKKEN